MFKLASLGGVVFGLLAIAGPEGAPAVYALDRAGDYTVMRAWCAFASAVALITALALLWARVRERNG